MFNGWLEFKLSHKIALKSSGHLQPSKPTDQLDANWHWSEAHKNAFKRIKQATTQAPVLRYLNPAQETVLQCNTSTTGLGPTLLQNGQPTGICTPERNYTQIKKELLAMCLEQRNLIKNVFIKRDDKPLEVIYKEPLIAAPNHVQTMLIHLQK